MQVNIGGSKCSRVCVKLAAPQKCVSSLLPPKNDLCVKLAARGLCGVCCVDTLMIYVKVAPRNDIVATQQTPWTTKSMTYIPHQSRCKVEAWCINTSKLRHGVFQLGPQSCAVYPHNLGQSCHKHVLCMRCLWCLCCPLPVPAALNPVGGAPHVGRRPSAAPQGHRPGTTQDTIRRDEIMHI